MKSNKSIRNLAGILLVSTALFSGGCGKDSTPNIPLDKNAEIPVSQSSQYKVKLVATFEDDLAYKGKRGIYEITDTQTKKTYLGVSGIGITELGSHSAGNSSASDER